MVERNFDFTSDDERGGVFIGVGVLRPECFLALDRDGQFGDIYRRNCKLDLAGIMRL